MAARESIRYSSICMHWPVFRFLEWNFPRLPYLAAFLSRLQTGAKFLDVGCGFGQDLRFLHHFEHIPAHQLYGFDLVPTLVNISFDLFQDQARFGSTIFSADLMRPSFSEAHTELDKLRGKCDLIQLSQVLHHFDWDNSFEATKRVVSLATPEPGTIIAGTQMGSRNPGSYAMPSRTSAGTGKNYRHNADSMKRFWDQVGAETDSEWKVECQEIYSAAGKDNKDEWWLKNDPGVCMICFSATRM